MDNGGGAWGNYKIPLETNLKQYYIKEEYTDEHFGTGKVLAPIGQTRGRDRFYVMKLNDFSISAYSWYYNASGGHLDSNYNTSSSANDFAVAGEEPTGKINTERMMASWNEEKHGDKHDNDIWGVIQSEVSKGWFVPSKSEWAVFGATFNITRSNYYDTFGLSDVYWSSSQSTTSQVYTPRFNIGSMSNYFLSYSLYVRLATTF